MFFCRMQCLTAVDPWALLGLEASLQAGLGESGKATTRAMANQLRRASLEFLGGTTATV